MAATVIKHPHMMPSIFHWILNLNCSVRLCNKLYLKSFLAFSIFHKVMCILLYSGIQYLLLYHVPHTQFRGGWKQIVETSYDLHVLTKMCVQSQLATIMKALKCIILSVYVLDTTGQSNPEFSTDQYVKSSQQRQCNGIQRKDGNLTHALLGTRL